MLAFACAFCAMLMGTQVLHGCDTNADEHAELPEVPEVPTDSCLDPFTGVTQLLTFEPTEFSNLVSAIIALREGDGAVDGLIEAMKPFFNFTTGHYTVDNDAMSIQLEMDCVSFYQGWVELQQPVFSWNLPLSLPIDPFATRDSVTQSAISAWMGYLRGFQIQGSASVASAVLIDDAVISWDNCFLLQGSLSLQGVSSFSEQVLLRYKNMTSQRADTIQEKIDDCNYEDLATLQQVNASFTLCPQAATTKYEVVGSTWNGAEFESEGVCGLNVSQLPDPVEGATFGDATYIPALMFLQLAHLRFDESNYTTC
jgi:hypothetical protein